MSAYIDQDQLAAIGDMISLRGETVTIGDKPYRGYVEKGNTSQDASEFGIDDFSDEYEITILADEAPAYSDTVTFRDRFGEIDNIEPLGDSAFALTVSLNE